MIAPIPRNIPIPTDNNAFPLSERDQRFVDALATSLRQRSEKENKTAYMLSVTYAESKEFPLTPASANQQLNKVHRCLLERLARSKRMSRPWFRNIEPVVYAFLDVPSPKTSKRLAKVPFHPSTFHHQGIVLVDERHVAEFDALTNPAAAESFIAQCSQHPVKQHRCQIRTIHIQRIVPTDADMKNVVRYCSKHYRRQPDDIERLQMYPISDSELSNK